jgi:hypothetical protein
MLTSITVIGSVANETTGANRVPTRPLNVTITEVPKICKPLEAKRTCRHVDARRSISGPN